MLNRNHRPAREVVTPRYFRDPPEHRAGRAPDCEWSLAQADYEEAHRLLGKEPTNSGNFPIADLKAVREQAERLAPRRYTRRDPS